MLVRLLFLSVGLLVTLNVLYPYIAEKEREIDQNCTSALHWWSKSMLCVKQSYVTPNDILSKFK